MIVYNEILYIYIYKMRFDEEISFFNGNINYKINMLNKQYEYYSEKVFYNFNI